jgi:hypothetical protein
LAGQTGTSLTIEKHEVVEVMDDDGVQQSSHDPAEVLGHPVEIVNCVPSHISQGRVKTSILTRMTNMWTPISGTRCRLFVAAFEQLSVCSNGA